MQLLGLQQGVGGGEGVSTLLAPQGASEFSARRTVYSLIWHLELRLLGDSVVIQAVSVYYFS